MELYIPASPSRLAQLREAARAHLRGVSDEVADDFVLALNEAATNAVLYGSSGDQPIQVRVQVHDDWVEASVLDSGPEPPAGAPSRYRHRRAARRRAGPVAAAAAGG
jgi:anti-sigma regulatory factor (Ser/Thr protein kinase)